MSELPSYTQHMDVCTLCYKVDDYTKFIYPLKLHESLASGLPCVGAPIRTLREFAVGPRSGGYGGGMVRGSRRGDDRPAARSEARSAARRAVARDHDWDRLVHQIATALGERLGPSYRQRVQQGLPALRPLARDA